MDNEYVTWLGVLNTELDKVALRKEQFDDEWSNAFDAGMTPVQALRDAVDRLQNKLDCLLGIMP